MFGVIYSTSFEIKGLCPDLNKKKKDFVLCLYTPVSRSVPEMQGIHATGGHPFLRMYLWWSLWTLYLHREKASLVFDIAVALELGQGQQPLYEPGHLNRKTTKNKTKIKNIVRTHGVYHNNNNNNNNNTYIFYSAIPR